jgi:hypothetical protein
MNYNHLNKIHEYWHDKVLPNISHNCTVTSFDDYLKKFSFLKSGRWLKEMVSVKIHRMGFVVGPEAFTKNYKSKCVTYNAPMKPEDGLQRIIYQISPTLHVEFALWIWMEHDIVNSYGSVLVCYNNEKEFNQFMDELYLIKRTGNTEDKPVKTGFAGFAGITK